MNATRLAALLFALLGIGAILLALMPHKQEAPLDVVSSTQCASCHPGVAAEWKASHHAIAFVNPEVRKLSQDFRNEECLACHAPRPVLLFPPGERVLARASDRALGVDCLACHADPAGGVATSNPHPRTDAPCRPHFVARIQQVDTCSACHNQHKTVDQWRAAPTELDGKPFRGDDCLHCHMPETWRQGGRKGRDHSFRASHDLPSLQRAVTLEGSWEEDGVRAAVRNHGAAHNFPTDERSRAADVQIRWRRGSTWSDWERVHRFRDPYRDETDLTNTELPAGERWEETVPFPVGAVVPDAAELRLLYRTNPFLPDPDSAELARVELHP